MQVVYFLSLILSVFISQVLSVCESQLVGWTTDPTTRITEVNNVRQADWKRELDSICSDFGVNNCNDRKLKVNICNGNILIRSEERSCAREDTRCFVY